MEVSGVLFRPIQCFPGAGVNAHSRFSSVKLFPVGFPLEAGDKFSGKVRSLRYRESTVHEKSRKQNWFLGSGFDDVIQYYRPTVRCGGGKKDKHKDVKKKVKLLKGLSKNLSNFSEIEFGLDSGHDLADQVLKGELISEAAEILLKELQQLRAQEKELKKKRKELKAKLKASRIQNHEESSDSSDSECGQVVNMSQLKTKIHTNPTENELQEQESTSIPSTTPAQQPLTQQESLASTSMPVQGGTLIEESGSEPSTRTSTDFSNAGNFNIQNSVSNGASERKIEVCMGGKCKKSGAALLLEEFERAVGDEGSVVGCKCMGKCRDGPNVRVLNVVYGIEADENVRTPSNPMCIGVGLEEVSLIVSKLFGGNEKDFGLATAS